MGAVELEVVDAIWAAVESLLPDRTETQSVGLSSTPSRGPALVVGDLDPCGDRLLVGGHRSDPRTPRVRHDAARPTRRMDRSWRVRPTRRRSRSRLRPHRRLGPVRPQHRRVARQSPYGGEETGPNPTDRAKLAWKWSVASERAGIPIGWVVAPANRNDIVLLEPTSASIADRGLLSDIETLHLDPSYDYPVIRRRLTELGLDDHDIQRPGTKTSVKPPPIRHGMRWIVEATNTWWSNYGQLRRNTHRRSRHRHAAPRLATTVVIVGPLIDRRKR
jgi:hypothetical protein